MHIAAQRLYNQHLEGEKFNTPKAVVRALGAVQAQEYALAKWALGLRMRDATDDVVEQAFTDGAILRTHLMRPTWHFVAAEDIRWILQLTAPRVHAVNAYMYRQLELDDPLLRRSDDLIAGALVGGKTLTRAELGALLAAAGIDTTNGMRLGYLVHHAELEGVVCSGARRGKQHTYALLDERAPQAQRLSADEALAELTRRFFTSHGPATVKDFAWWSGLTIASVKAGLALLGAELVHETVEGETYWFASAMPCIPQAPASGHLLPVYDEYTIAYKKHSALLDPAYTEQTQNRFFTSAFVYRGEIIGMWRRTVETKSVQIELAPFCPFSSEASSAANAAAERFASFLGLAHKLLVVST